MTCIPRCSQARSAIASRSATQSATWSSVLTAGGEDIPCTLLIAARHHVLMTSWWARAPLRIKLTLAFTGVMAVLLAGAGHRAQPCWSPQNLDSTIDDGLEAPRRRRRRARARGRRGPARLSDSGEAFAQVLEPDGKRAATRRRAPAPRPLLTPARAATRPRPGGVDRRAPPREGADERIRAARPAPAPTGTGEVVVVVGESLAQRERALDAPARAAGDRRPARAADRLAGRLRARRRRAAAGRADAPPRGGA